MRYSVACENDDIEDFSRKSEAIKYAKSQAKLGKSNIIINVMTVDGEYLDCIKID